MMPEPGREPRLFDDLETWVNDYFTPMFLHRIDEGTRHHWCPRWWDHAEAIARLTLLWHTWEAARWHPNNKPAWWHDLDHHLLHLTAPDGPFRTCRAGQHGRSSRHLAPGAPKNRPAPQQWWAL